MKRRIRKALARDGKIIKRLIGEGAREGQVLPRSLNEVYENMRDFWVAEEGGGIVGCAALHLTWEDLGEVKSLVVAEKAREKGIGISLVKRCLKEAKAMGLARVFALTSSPDFFVRAGFREVERSELPQKVWGECIRCVKFPDCDEVPFMYELE